MSTDFDYRMTLRKIGSINNTQAVLINQMNNKLRYREVELLETYNVNLKGLDENGKWYFVCTEDNTQTMVITQDYDKCNMPFAIKHRRVKPEQIRFIEEE